MRGRFCGLRCLSGVRLLSGLGLGRRGRLSGEKRDDLERDDVAGEYALSLSRSSPILSASLGDLAPNGRLLAVSSSRSEGPTRGRSLSLSTHPRSRSRSLLFHGGVPGTNPAPRRGDVARTGLGLLNGEAVICPSSGDPDLVEGAFGFAGDMARESLKGSLSLSSFLR